MKEHDTAQYDEQELSSDSTRSSISHHNHFIWMFDNSPPYACPIGRVFFLHERRTRINSTECRKHKLHTVRHRPSAITPHVITLKCNDRREVSIAAAHAQKYTKVPCAGVLGVGYDEETSEGDGRIHEHPWHAQTCAVREVRAKNCPEYRDKIRWCTEKEDQGCSVNNGTKNDLDEVCEGVYRR